MKQQRMFLVLTLVIFAAVAVTSFAQGRKDDKDKGNQKEQRDKDKGNKKDKQDQGNRNNKNNRNDDNNAANGKGKNNNSGNNNGRGKDKSDDRNDAANGRHKMKDGYKWDNATFSDRKKIRNNQEKVTICHKPRNGNGPGVTLRVAEPAVRAHLNHGDVLGDCPAVSGNHSDVFLRRRADYFNVLQDSQEQVLYSQSILDYAVQRLTGARTQLVTLQRNNAPAAEIEQRRLLIIDLEQNVSLLQTLLGVTANMLAQRWAN